MRVNDKNKLITGKTVYDKFEEFRSRIKNFRSEDYRRAITEYLKGKVVIAGYGNFRAYRIGEISFDRDINNTAFEIEKEGKKESLNIKTYYKRQYNIDIRHEDQPLIIEEVPRNRRDDENKVVRYLIPELCYLTGIDELNETDRARIITKSKFQPNEIRMEWGINIDENFVEVEAQCIPIPLLEFGDKKEAPQMRNGRFRQLRDFNPIHFNNHNCILITFDNLTNLAKNDCNQMEIAGRKLGVKFELPKLEEIHNKHEEKLLDDLRKINYNDGKVMAIVVLDRFTKNLYPTIKNFLYTQGGLTSQFMLHDENPKGGRKKQNISYYSAVLNQMVVKSKGELFRINFTEKISKMPSMILGIDSTMTKEGKKFVLSASFNRNFNKFYTDFKIDKENESALEYLIKSALDHFSNVNNKNLPGRVIIYRQGGNEKQTEKMMKFELPKILKGFEEYKENYKPKLSIFGVNKKTDLKFFERSDDGYRNIPAGTVIDKNVVSPDVFEFYLQCPEVERGTGSPVHFLCLYNNNDELTINDFEEITYQQSYYYWNWPGPIRIPAALKYAEVANTFCGKNIKGSIRDNLKDSPYFI